MNQLSVATSGLRGCTSLQLAIATSGFRCSIVVSELPVCFYKKTIITELNNTSIVMVSLGATTVNMKLNLNSIIARLSSTIVLEKVTITVLTDNTINENTAT